MKVEFVNKIRETFVYIKGMREPLYGEHNELIGIKDAGNSEVEPRIVIVAGKENQVKKFHNNLWNQVVEHIRAKDERIKYPKISTCNMCGRKTTKILGADIELGIPIPIFVCRKCAEHHKPPHIQIQVKGEIQ